MQYHTFDILITASGTAHYYHLFSKSTSQGEISDNTRIDNSSLPLAELLDRHRNRSISPEDVQTLGVELYRRLFVDKIGLLFNRSLGVALANDDLGLRLRLRIDAPELAVLPWELLYSPERHLFLAASIETPLSRYLNLPQPVRSLEYPKTVRILAAIPQNSGLDTETERRGLAETTEKLGGKISVSFLEGEATSRAIRAALRQQDYHIFHYAGHGSFVNDRACLYLDHEEKLIEPMSADIFAQFFLDYPSIRLVFLNSCKGAARSAHQALIGAAPQLVLRGVPAVIAMQDSFDNNDAILLATEFYSELCNERTGGQAEFALARARKALLQEKPISHAFANPVLYLRAENGRLWEIQQSEQPVTRPTTAPKPEEKKSPLDRWQLWVGLIGGILAIVLAVLDLPEKLNKLVMSTQEPDSTQTVTELQFQTLAGQVLDSNNRVLPGVIISLPEYDTTTATNHLGRFEFKLKTPEGARVSLRAEKEGYETLTRDPTVGDHFNTYKMRSRSEP